MKKAILAMLIALFTASNAHAYVVTCTNCSNTLIQTLEQLTNVEQLLQLQMDYAESLEQTMQQIEMVRQNVEQYANMVQNTIQLPQQLISKISGEFQKLASVTQQLDTLRGDISALGQIHEQLYMSQDEISGLTSTSVAQLRTNNTKIRQEWDKWSERVDEATEATFKLSGSQLKELEDASEFESYINDLLQTPDGQQKAIMAGNQLAALQIQEMRQMRELMATQIQSDLASQNKSEKESQLAAEKEKALFDMSGFDNLTPKDDPF